MSGLSHYTVRNKGRRENWVGLRRAYLARVGEINAGHELGFYSTENYQAEIASMNAATKLGIVLNKYLDEKFGDILNDDLANGREIDDLDISNIDMRELKDAVNVAKEVYTLQRKIYDNAPREESEMYETLLHKNDKRPLSDQERKAKIKQLEAKIGKSFNTLFELNHGSSNVKDIDAEVID